MTPQQWAAGRGGEGRGGEGRGRGYVVFTHTHVCAPSAIGNTKLNRSGSTTKLHTTTVYPKRRVL